MFRICCLIILMLSSAVQCAGQQMHDFFPLRDGMTKLYSYTRQHTSTSMSRNDISTDEGYIRHSVLRHELDSMHVVWHVAQSTVFSNRNRHWSSGVFRADSTTYYNWLDTLIIYETLDSLHSLRTVLPRRLLERRSVWNFPIITGFEELRIGPFPVFRYSLDSNRIIIRRDSTEYHQNWQARFAYTFVENSGVQKFTSSQRNGGVTDFEYLTFACTLIDSTIMHSELTTTSPAAISLSASYPNPASDHTTFMYSLQQEAHVRGQFHDAYGRVVDIPVNEYHAPGAYHVTVPVAVLPAGMYFFVLHTGTEVIRRSMLVVH